MKEIFKAITKVAVQGILDWKFPIFVGALFTLNAIFIFMNEALREYNDFAAVPPLTWIKLLLGAASAGIGALISYVSTSVSRTRDEIKEKQKITDTTKI